MYTIRSVPGKGQAMFADKDIQAGDRILDDESLFSVADGTLNEGIGDRIRVSFENLPPEQQQQFERLHCPNHRTWTPLVSRYLANCYEVEAPGTGIFLKASRINNSCSPNAFFSWNRNLHRLTIHAIVDIPAGEEITVCYTFPFFSWRSRQTLFTDHYLFECDCSACHPETITGRRSDLRRQRMETLFSAIENSNGGPSDNDEKELDMVLEFVDLAETERLDGNFLSWMYFHARKCYGDRGSKELALKYAEMELETDTRLLGEDHPMTEDSAEALEELKAQLAWKEQEGEE